MAELNAFSYRPGASVLHGLDVRFKLAFLVIVSLSILKAMFPALLLLTIMLFALAADVRLPIKSTTKELRYFLVLLLLVFIARVLTTAGDSPAPYATLPVMRAGVRSGVLICWRLVIIVTAGLLFVSTTRPLEIKAAVEWYLRPFFGFRGKRIATMMSLVMRFMPLILDQARETADARRARGVENRKNPLYRLKTYALPLIRRTFESADALAIAMEARCYNEQRTSSGLLSTRKDWAALAVVAGVCFIILIT